MDIITKRAYMLMANQLGEQAANLEMIDSTGKPTALYDVKSPYTIVVFWDQPAGIVKKRSRNWIPCTGLPGKLKKLRSMLYFRRTKTEWVKYIKEHGIGDWVNVYQTKEMEDAIVAAQKPGFRQLYDVTSTPTLYLLDKEKRIIGKKLTWKQLDELLQVKMNSESTK